MIRPVTLNVIPPNVPSSRNGAYISNTTPDNMNKQNQPQIKKSKLDIYA